MLVQEVLFIIRSVNVITYVFGFVYFTQEILTLLYFTLKIEDNNNNKIIEPPDRTTRRAFKHGTTFAQLENKNNSKFNSFTKKKKIFYK